jgi:hypothetical protein
MKLDTERLDPLLVDIAGRDNGLDKALLHFEGERDVWMKVAQRTDSRHHHAISLKSSQLMIPPDEFR